MAKKKKAPNFMLIIKSDEADKELMESIKKELQKSLKKKHGRIPILGVGKDDSIELIKF
jgi:D-arabinose 5-phosphate isomerase GutQ